MEETRGFVLVLVESQWSLSRKKKVKKNYDLREVCLLRDEWWLGVFVLKYTIFLFRNILSILSAEMDESEWMVLLLLLSAGRRVCY